MEVFKLEYAYKEHGTKVIVELVAYAPTIEALEQVTYMLTGSLVYEKFSKVKLDLNNLKWEKNNEKSE